METATQLAADMRVYAPEHTLVGNYLYSKFDANLISQLTSLMAPDRAGIRIDVQTSEYERLTEGLSDSFEVHPASASAGSESGMAIVPMWRSVCMCLVFVCLNSASMRLSCCKSLDDGNSNKTHIRNAC